MKRLWFGVILLIALLGIGIGSSIVMNRIHRQISADLSAAETFALNGNWDQAAAFSAKARSGWEQHWHRTATVANHEPMEEIDGLFSKLEVFLYHKDKLSFCAYCAHLRVLTEALGEGHIANWWNLL